MYLKLYYTVIYDEIEHLIINSLSAAVRETPLRQHARLLVARVLSHVKQTFSSYSLEGAALLGEVSTAFLSEIQWEKQFEPYGVRRLASGLPRSSFHGRKIGLSLLATPSVEDSHAQSSILIPVDIPPLPLSMADIKPRSQCTRRRMPSAEASLEGSPVVCINQPPRQAPSGSGRGCGTPATLLPPTRLVSRHTLPTWARPSNSASRLLPRWIPGCWLGRRKGHFVIPGRDASADVLKT